MHLLGLLGFSSLVALVAALPVDDTKKHDGKELSRDEATERANAVKEVFQTAWDGYSECVLPFETYE